jgi:hypothetical protein
MSSHDDVSARALRDVSSRVDAALSARRRQPSSGGSVASQLSVGSYVAVRPVPTHVAAGRLATSRGTLASSRLQGRRAPPMTAAAGLIGGGLGGGSQTPVALRAAVSTAGKSPATMYSRATEVAVVGDWSRTCCCLLGDRFCIMTNVDGKNSCGNTHKGEKFHPAGALVETYFVPAKPVKNKKVAFCSPSIEVGRITPSMRNEFTIRTPSKQWETLILSAEEAWQAMQAALSDDNDSHSIDSGASGDISYLLDVTDYSPPEAIEIPDAVFRPDEDDIEDNMSEALLSTREALNTAVGKIQELAASLPQVGNSTAEYIRPVLNSIIEKINQHSDSIVELYADAAELTSVNQEVALASGPDEEQAEVIQDLQDTVAKLVSEVYGLEGSRATKVEVANAVVDSAIVIGDNIAGIAARLATIEITPAHGTAPSARSGLHLNTMLIDDDGADMMTLRDLAFKLTTLENQMKTMQESFESEGGVVFGTHRFASEEALMRLIMKLHPKGDGLAAFSDASSIFCHDKELSSSSDPHKMLSKLGVNSAVDRNYILSFDQRYPPKYAGTAKSLEAGDKLDVLKSIARWRGVSASDGERQKIQTTLRSCKKNVIKYADDQIPVGELREMARDMASASIDFHDKLHAHFEDEITKLTQLDIPDAEALELVTEQFTLVFDSLFECRQAVMSYTGEGGDKVPHMVRCLWITLNTHMKMEAFFKNGLKFDPIISASFIRFLTKQTGSNVAAGVGGKLKALETKMRKEIKETETAALIPGKKALNKLDQMFAKNPTLVKPRDS